ncbi:MAG: GIY-YIG nuclease family protein [Dongiaceae bacterium]
MAAFVYILRCRDGRFYVGSTRGSLEKRFEEHNAGTYGGFTKSRRPVALVYSDAFERITDAIAAERRLKGWSRAKKEALIAGDLKRLAELSRSRSSDPHPSTGSG